MPTKKETDAPVEVSVAGVSAPHIERADQGFSGNQLLPPTGAPGAKMVKVKELATGRVTGMWAVDAREAINAGGHAYAAADEALAPSGTGGVERSVSDSVPADSGEPVTIDPVPSVAPKTISVAAESLEDMSKTDLQALAKRAGVSDQGTKAELIDALQPHVKAGTVALSAPSPLAPAPPRPR